MARDLKVGLNTV